MTAFFRTIGLHSSGRSISMLVFSWFLNVLWLGINYMRLIISVEVLVGVQVVLLLYAALALVAYVYWGMKEVREQEASYANVLVGVIVAATLLYLNYTLLQLVLGVAGK